MSAFEADRFNRSRTSPEKAFSRQPSARAKIPRFARNDSFESSLPTTSDRRTATVLTTAFKERLQQFRTAAGQDSLANFHAMVESRMIQHLHHRVHRACFRIVRAIDQTFDPRMYQGCGTHRAWFDCSKQV